MAVDKIDLNTLNEMREQLDIETRLPKINQLIETLAEPYMEEVKRLTSSDKLYEIDENGDIVYDESDEINNTLAQLDSLIDEISALEDVETYIRKEMANGLSTKEATVKFDKEIAVLEEKMKKILNLNEEENTGSV